MKFYHVKDDYIKYLKKYDSRVSDNKAEKRPYVGIVLEINGHKYYAPFSSPKKKHLTMKNSMDFRKIAGGKYGAINFNNMIPVKDEALILVDFEGVSDKQYKRLLQNQYNEIRKDAEAIKNAARKLYTLACKEDKTLKSFENKIKERCIDFKLLESIYKK